MMGSSGPVALFGHVGGGGGIGNKREEDLQ